MKTNQTKRWVMTALFAALTCVATMVLVVPSPSGGYMNLGDTVVLLSAYLLGPVFGAIAAGVGSALADILLGAAVYAPATLVIKAVMAVLAGMLYKVLREKRGGALLCAAVGEIPMVAGYCLYDAFLADNMAVGMAGIPSNLMQAAFGIAASTLLLFALKRSHYVRREFLEQ